MEDYQRRLERSDCSRKMWLPQDATYWSLTPANVTTAWIVLSESTSENGCLRVVSGTHKASLLPQRETYAADNMLSRGQEIAVEVDEAQAVDFLCIPAISRCTTSVSSTVPARTIRRFRVADWPCDTFRRMLCSLAPSATSLYSSAARKSTDISILSTAAERLLGAQSSEPGPGKQ